LDGLALAGPIQALRGQLHADMSLYMTAETEHDPLPDPVAVHEPARRSGSIILVLLVAAGLVGVVQHDEIQIRWCLYCGHAQPFDC